jgi:hypothetical protein
MLRAGLLMFAGRFCELARSLLLVLSQRWRWLAFAADLRGESSYDTAAAEGRHQEAGDGSMSQTTLNTTPLFQTSLRDWQASWKANRPQDRSAASTVTPRPGRLGRRSPRLAVGRAQS